MVLALVLAGLLSTLATTFLPTLGRFSRLEKSIRLYERLCDVLTDPDERERSVLEKARKRVTDDATKAYSPRWTPDKHAIKSFLWCAYIYGTNLFLVMIAVRLGGGPFRLAIAYVAWIALVLLTLKRIHGMPKRRHARGDEEPREGEDDEEANDR
jgi:hypothetical protein